MSPSLTELEQKYVLDSVKSSWIGGAGEYIDNMERVWAELCGAEFALMVSNGTVAISLALQAIGVGPGDEVIVPAMTYAATANAVRHVGAEPVFVDVEESTWCMDPALLDQAYTDKVKAVIPVDLFGHPADIDPILRFAEANELKVIVDAAQSHLARYKGSPVGSLADMTTFSFHVGKIFTSGEGGAITLDDPELAARLKILREHGMDPNRRFYHPVVGTNSRLTNMQAAVLSGQIERRAEITSQRNSMFSTYKTGLSGISGLTFRPEAEWAEITPWVFCIGISESEFGCSRDQLIDNLAKNNIETRPFYFPLHRLPPYSELSKARGEHCPVSDRLSEEGMYLPSSTDISADELGYVIEAIKNEAANI